MTIKTILIEISGNASDEAVLDTAWLVAQPHGAHITVLHLRRDQLMPGWDAGTVDYAPIIEVMQDEAKKREAEASRRFEAWRTKHRMALAEEPSASSRPSVAWRVESAVSMGLLSDCGRVSDLTVLLRPEISRTDTTIDFETLLFDTGRPVLLAPAKPDGRLYEHMVIAWDGSTEAARAVALAMPLLEEAKMVSVFTGGDRPDGGSGREPAALIKHLAWHGITAGIAPTRPDAPSIGEDLLASCRAAEASLLVMGAYTHSRLAQVVLGGVTRHVLSHAELPLLMTH